MNAVIFQTQVYLLQYCKLFTNLHYCNNVIVEVFKLKKETECLHTSLAALMMKSVRALQYLRTGMRHNGFPVSYYRCNTMLYETS